MLFDYTIRIDTVILTGSTLLAGGLFFGALRGDLKALTQRVAKVEEAAQEQVKVLIAIATQDQRLDDIERRIGKMEH